MADSKFADWLDVVAEPANKRTVVFTMEYFMYIENKKFRSERSSITTLEEKADNIPMAFSMSKYHPMIEEFSDKILRKAEMGKVFLRNLRFNHRSEEIPALVLSMDDLWIGFLGF